MADERRIVIVGCSGSGKSTLLRALADAPPDDRAPWLVDPLCEHADPAHKYGARFAPKLDGAMYDADGPFFDMVDEIAHDAYEDGGVFLLIDECDLACRRGHAAPPWLVRVVMHGRHREISWCFATRRPAEIPRALTSQASEFFCFRLTEPVDLEHARARGLDPRAVASLPRGAFFHVVAGRPAHQHTGYLSPCTTE